MDVRFRPARGLTALTWAQIEKIDAKVKALCQATAEGGEGRLVVVVKRGKARFVETVISEALEPVRPQP